MMIVPMTGEHAERVLEIYRLGIATGNATFETEPPTWASFEASRLPEHRLVLLDGDGNDNDDDNADGDRVLGWAACSRVSERRVYAGVVEHSVYVHPDARGRGAGRALLEALIASTEAAGIWTIQSGIFPENTASLALHEKCGFRVIGTREKVGRHHGIWRDVLLLERRSQKVL